MSDILIRELQSTDTVPWSLFLLADPSKAMIKKYFPLGKCFVAINKSQIIGEYIILSKEAGIWELMNIGVKEEFQGKGIGKQLLHDALEKVKNFGGKMVQVGTGDSSKKQLQFYQNNGFTVTRTEKNFFVKNYPEPIIENGTVCKDKIILSLNL